MILCLNIFAREVDMYDVGFWQVVDGTRLCTYRFIGGQATSKGEVQDAVIVSCFIRYDETSKALQNLHSSTTKDYDELRCGFDEDVSSRSQVSPLVIEGSEEVVVLEVDSEDRGESNQVCQGELEEGYVLTPYFSTQEIEMAYLVIVGCT